MAPTMHFGEKIFFSHANSHTVPTPGEHKKGQKTGLKYEPKLHIVQLYILPTSWVEGLILNNFVIFGNLVTILSVKFCL